jgi:hypothetical protein
LIPLTVGCPVTTKLNTLLDAADVTTRSAAVPNVVFESTLMHARVATHHSTGADTPFTVTVLVPWSAPKPLPSKHSEPPALTGFCSTCVIFGPDCAGEVKANRKQKIAETKSLLDAIFIFSPQYTGATF